MDKELMRQTLHKLCERCAPSSISHNDFRLEVFDAAKIIQTYDDLQILTRRSKLQHANGEQYFHKEMDFLTGLIENTKTVVLIVRKHNLHFSEDTDEVRIKSLPLHKRKLARNYSICKGSMYAQQPSAFSEGTGFFIAPRTIATAAHVIVHAGYDLQDYYFVQHYINSNSKNYEHEIVISKSAIWKCVSTDKKLSPDSYQYFSKGSDWAMIRVKPAFEQASPNEVPAHVRFPISQSSSGSEPARMPQKGDLLYALGHGMGLPLKVSILGEITAKKNNTFFESSLTLLGGNSGSPVFFVEDHSLAGIYMRGVKKLKMIPPQDCLTIKPEEQTFEGQECQLLAPVAQSLATHNIRFSHL